MVVIQVTAFATFSSVFKLNNFFCVRINPQDTIAGINNPRVSRFVTQGNKLTRGGHAGK